MTDLHLPQSTPFSAFASGVLSKNKILQGIEDGRVIIEPFNLSQLNTVSYDVTIGDFFYREDGFSSTYRNDKNEIDALMLCILIFNSFGSYLMLVEGKWLLWLVWILISIILYFGTKQILNITSPKVVQLLNAKSSIKLWEQDYSVAIPYREWLARQCTFLSSELQEQQKMKSKYNIDYNLSDLVIEIGPGENILAHTREFIGSKKNITTSMQARSTVGRTCIAVCKCAGWGDINYFNRWTMEITNFSNTRILMRVGDPIAQIIFFTVATDINETLDYTQGGHYQTTNDLQKLKNEWKPRNMLPSGGVPKKKQE